MNVFLSCFFKGCCNNILKCLFLEFYSGVSVLFCKLKYPKLLPANNSRVFVVESDVVDIINLYLNWCESFWFHNYLPILNLSPPAYMWYGLSSEIEESCTWYWLHIVSSLQSAVVQLEVVRWIEHQISCVRFVRRRDKLGLLL